MKKTYKKPLAVNYDLERCAFPAALAAGVGLATGYAIGRVVTNAVRAVPVIKLEPVSR